jgi:hypothetical protein
VPGRVDAAVERQNLNIDQVRGTIWKGSLVASIAKVADVTIDYHASQGGNLHAHYISFRLDAGRGSRKVLAGVTGGRSTLDPQRPVELPSAPHSLEIFAGATIGPNVTMIVSNLQFEKVERYTALLVWKFGR